MFDDINNREPSENENVNENVKEPAQEPTPVNEDNARPEQETQAPQYNNTYAPGGSYYGYRQNGDGRQYGQSSYTNYGAGYGGGYYNGQQNSNRSYGGYNYGYQQNGQQYARQQSGSKGSGGKIAAVIAVCLCVVIVFSLMSVVAIAWMIRGIGGNSVVPPDDTTPGIADTTLPDDPVTAPADTQTDAPLTDPNAAVHTNSSSETLPMTEAAAKAVNSVVEIRTEQVVPGSFMQQYISEGAGSGVIVTKDGYIATNNHVIDGATHITVILRDGTEYEAKLVGTDSQADLAVVKIDANDLQPATFGDSDKLIVAETVIAIGNPLGELGGSVTDGIISALARNVTIEKQEMTLLQTTAAVNPGNSGGGLFNMSGECVGIVNAKSSGTDIEGIGFAIPSNTAVSVIDDLMKYGYVRGRVMLGITMLEVFDNYTAKKYGVSEFGVYVSAVGEGSDAEKAGIKVGDRLVSISGEAITDYQQARKLIQSCTVGQKVQIVVSRNGSDVTLDVTFSEYIPK